MNESLEIDIVDVWEEESRRIETLGTLLQGIEARRLVVEYIKAQEARDVRRLAEIAREVFKAKIKPDDFKGRLREERGKGRVRS